MLSKETPKHKTEDSKGAGRQGGIPKDQLDHTAGTSEELLAEIELRDRKEKNKKCHLNPSRGEGRVHNGTHEPGDS
jgi:hypothetical protein